MKLSPVDKVGQIIFALVVQRIKQIVLTFNAVRLNRLTNKLTAIWEIKFK